jgi:EAL domain-containing protein (putative c-di-GMP-specific phosphodiesterase class I)
MIAEGVEELEQVEFLQAVDADTFYDYVLEAKKK